MPIQTFPTTVPTPSYSLAATTKPRVQRVQFGDGYSLRMADGLNNMISSWDIQWEGLTRTEKDTIETFLRARRGYEAFYWTPPNGTQKRVASGEWKITETNPAVFDIDVTFTEEIL